MIHSVEPTLHENFRRIGADEGLADLTAQPFQMGETLMVPAHKSTGAVITRCDGAKMVMMALKLDDVGFFVALTPDGARHMAEFLTTMAVEAEKPAAAQAAAAIEKARGK